MGQVYQCWWKICREINVSFFSFEYHMFYVSYPFVAYLLTASYNRLVLVHSTKGSNLTLPLLLSIKYTEPESASEVKSPSQKITYHLRNPGFHYRVHNNTVLVPKPSHSYILKIQFSDIFHLRLGSPPPFKLSPTFRLPGLSDT
jgi:hypothetical protein